jgi:hypothetical protein
MREMFGEVDPERRNVHPLSPTTCLRTDVHVEESLTATRSQAMKAAQHQWKCLVNVRCPGQHPILR